MPLTIVFEGPDNSGKSTLAQHVAKALDLPITSSEGPEKYPGEINERVERWLNLDGPRIFDRHPCVSHPIYSTLGGRTAIRPDLLERFYGDHPLFIYCRARNGSLDGHVMKDHDTPEHLADVQRSFTALCVEYEVWAANHAHYIYRIGNSMDNVVELVRNVVPVLPFDPVRDIEEFHTKFGLEYVGLPRQLPSDILSFRRRFLKEELDEYMAATSRLDQELRRQDLDEGEVTVQLENALDGLVDLVYVTLGTAYLHGFDFRKAWNRVHAANMKKVRAERASDSKRGSTFDVIKPAGWVAPSHADLVEGHAHRMQPGLDNRG